MRISAENVRFKNSSGFIVLEGVNGAGKGTQQQKIAEYLLSRGLKVHLTHEPGATELGQTLRDLLLSQQHNKLDAWSEVFLFLADRAEHLAKVIMPKLKAGYVVLCDRYYYSTLAFQGYGRGLNLEALIDLNMIAVNDLIPDFCVLLDLDPREGLRRSQKRNSSSADSFEAEELAFHQRLRDGFLELSGNLGDRFLVVDAAGSVEQTFEQIRPVLESWVVSLGHL